MESNLNENSWIKSDVPPRISAGLAPLDTKSKLPSGLWIQCTSCQKTLYRTDYENNFWVCPECGHHGRIGAVQRLRMMLDNSIDSLLIGEEIASSDFLSFVDDRPYKDRLSDARDRNSTTEAIVATHGEIGGQPVVVCAFDFGFMGGSMGSVVGERFYRAVTYAVENQFPFICVSASGGARMQEALVSLMQMAKTTMALNELSETQLPYVSVLTNPTMGGVSASFAMLGDIIIAEPGALIGFAGPRVIKQTVRVDLPDGFQTAEFLLSHGAIDMIVDRREMKSCLKKLLASTMLNRSSV